MCAWPSLQDFTVCVKHFYFPEFTPALPKKRFPSWACDIPLLHLTNLNFFVSVTFLPKQHGIWLSWRVHVPTSSMCKYTFTVLHPYTLVSVCVFCVSLQQTKLDQKVFEEKGQLREAAGRVRSGWGLTVAHFSWATLENKMLNWNSPMSQS